MPGPAAQRATKQPCAACGGGSHHTHGARGWNRVQARAKRGVLISTMEPENEPELHHQPRSGDSVPGGGGSSAGRHTFRSCLDREFVQKEIRWAWQYKKKIVVLYEKDDRRAGFFDFSQASAKYRGTEWAKILSIHAEPFQRDDEYAIVMVSKILRKMEGGEQVVEPARAAINAPGCWDLFLSHAQATGGDQAQTTYLRLQAAKKTVWYDNAMLDRSTAAMEEGVKHCRCFVLFLTGDTVVTQPAKQQMAAERVSEGIPPTGPAGAGFPLRRCSTASQMVVRLPTRRLSPGVSPTSSPGSSPERAQRPLIKHDTPSWIAAAASRLETSFRDGTEAQQLAAALYVHGFSPDIDDWLADAKLSTYASTIKQYGYDSLDSLLAADTADIKEMVQHEAVCMKKPHQKLMIRKWTELKQKSAYLSSRCQRILETGPASDPPHTALHLEYTGGFPSMFPAHEMKRAEQDIHQLRMSELRQLLARAEELLPQDKEEPELGSHMYVQVLPPDGHLLEPEPESEPELELEPKVEPKQERELEPDQSPPELAPEPEPEPELEPELPSNFEQGEEEDLDAFIASLDDMVKSSQVSEDSLDMLLAGQDAKSISLTEGSVCVTFYEIPMWAAEALGSLALGGDPRSRFHENIQKILCGKRGFHLTGERPRVRIGKDEQRLNDTGHRHIITGMQTGMACDQHGQARLQPRWVPSADACMLCSKTFGVLTRRHHCRRCGYVVCSSCSDHKVKLARWLEDDAPHALRESRSIEVLRVCNRCFTSGVDQTGLLVEPSGRQQLSSSSGAVTSAHSAAAYFAPSMAPSETQRAQNIAAELEEENAAIARLERQLAEQEQQQQTRAT
jgi:hypothetical protein